MASISSDASIPYRAAITFGVSPAATTWTRIETDVAVAAGEGLGGVVGVAVVVHVAAAVCVEVDEGYVGIDDFVIAGVTDEVVSGVAVNMYAELAVGATVGSDVAVLRVGGELAVGLGEMMGAARAGAMAVGESWLTDDLAFQGRHHHPTAAIQATRRNRNTSGTRATTEAVASFP